MMRKLFGTITILWLGLSLCAAQQDKMVSDSLRKLVRGQSGINKLETYLQLITLNLASQPAMAVRDARRAEQLAENVFTAEESSEERLQVKLRAYQVVGEAYENRRFYEDALQAQAKAIIVATQLGDDEAIADAEERIHVMSSVEGKDRSKVGRFVGDVFAKSESGIQDLRLSTALKAADFNEKKENYEAAIKHLEKARARLSDKGEQEAVANIDARIASLQYKLNPPPETPNPPTPPEETAELYVIDDTEDMEEIERQIAAIIKLSDGETAPEEMSPQVEDAAVRAVVIEQANNQKQQIEANARRAEESQDLEASLNYYKQYLALEQQLMEEQRVQDSTLAEIKLLQETSELQAEVSRKELQHQLNVKRSMAGGLGLAGALAASLLILYRNKRRGHTKLTTAYGDLKETQNELRSSQLRVRELLKQHVSGAVADELLMSPSANKVERKFVCVMFLDIRDFTPFAEAHRPEEIIDYQNRVFGFMIDVINSHGGIVNQILGDGFMATFGAPISSGNDCLNAFQAAQKIIEMVNHKNETGEIPETKVGIGLHAGNVVAGNVGTEQRKQYSITGNPVIIASRLEQLNKEFGSSLVISKEVFDHIPESDQPQASFNSQEVKGRSEPVEVASW